MGGVEQEQLLSLGVLIDIVDEQWMRDTLPADGNPSSSPPPPPFASSFDLTPGTIPSFFDGCADVPVPPAMAVKTEEAEDPAPASTFPFFLHLFFFSKQFWHFIPIWVNKMISGFWMRVMLSI